MAGEMGGAQGILPRTALLRTVAGMMPHDMFRAGIRVEERRRNTLAGIKRMGDPTYRNLALEQAERHALVHVDGRVQLIRALVKHLGIVPHRVVEFYSGPDLSGPLALPESRYVQVSDDPPVAAFDCLPEEFFNAAGLEAMAKFNTALLMALPRRVQKVLVTLLEQIFPNLVRFQEDIAHFSKRPEFRNFASLCLTLFWGSSPTLAMERAVEDGGYLVTVDHQPEVERRTAEVVGKQVYRGRGRGPISSVYAEELSRSFNEKLAGLPGYEELGIEVRVYQKRSTPEGIYLYPPLPRCTI